MTDTRAAFEAWAKEQLYPVVEKKPDGRYWSSHTHIVWETWQAAINHERSECAKVCEEIEEPAWYSYENPNSFYDGSGACAAAIRARSQP